MVHQLFVPVVHLNEDVKTVLKLPNLFLKDLNNQPSSQSNQQARQNSQPSLQNNQSSNTINTNSYDLNGDGVINSFDFAILLKDWRRGTGSTKEDFNHDGVVNSFDYSILKKAVSKQL